MRPDGTRVKDLPPLVAAIPYIMPKRYDAWNSVTENIDEEVIKDFIRTHRRAGVRLNHMSVIISAYYKAVLRNPKLNYFVMNGRIYRRNHFCVSFVILKKQADGVVNETTLKVYLDENDTVFTVNQKIKDAIDLDPRVTVLGHIQRGGSPTGRDRVNATKMGYLAVELLLQGKTNRIVCTHMGDFTDVDISEGLAMKKSIQKMEVDVLAAMTGI